MMPMMPMMMSPQMGSPAGAGQHVSPMRFPASLGSPGANMGMVMVPMPMPMDGLVMSPEGMFQSPAQQHTSLMSPLALSPMERYTQDILNAEGETFDLDFEKYASRLSDASTEDHLERRSSSELDASPVA
jgi:hypothetical protein